MPFQLPDLPYDYDALEPYIDAKTMEVHYTKHHQGYTDKLNAALEGYDHLQDKPIEELLENIGTLPKEIRTAVKNNGGGYANHALFWSVMSPDGGSKPEGLILEALETDFGDFETFKEEFNAAASGQFGSGWAWLVLDENQLRVVNRPNQDSPLMDSLTPILGLDVWEHAYYLKYQNRRGEYIENWWNLVNWDEVEFNYKNRDHM